MSGTSISDYSSDDLARVKATCLSIAQALGDTITEDAVIVGGLVPVLLYQNVDPVWEFGQHAGTRDVDLALDLVILEPERYERVADSLRRSGFAPDETESGNIVRQRWRARDGTLVDFLLPPVPPDTIGGRQQSLTNELAAFTMRGLDLALAHRMVMPLAGVDLQGRNVERRLPVCRAELFVMLKALASAGRDKPKDAYDIHYALLHDPRGPEGLGADLRALAPHHAIDAALESLGRDYMEVDSRGPRDVCTFLGRVGDHELAGDALAFVRAFLAAASGASS